MSFMRKMWRILLAIASLPLDVICAVFITIGSSIGIMVSVCNGMGYCDAVVKELNKRIEMLKLELEQVEELAGMLKVKK